MENLNIHITDLDLSCPMINCDFQKGTVTFEGDSFMEAADEYYEPAIKWIKRYLNEKDTLTLIIKLNYFNSSSFKILFDLFLFMKNSRDDAGKNIEIEWHFSYIDREIEDDIDDMDEQIEFGFKKILF